MYAYSVVAWEAMARKGDNAPTVEEVKAARLAARLTQNQAADVLGISIRVWQNWEVVDGRSMPRQAFELFLLKTGQFKVLGWKPPAKLLDLGDLSLKLSTGDIISLKMREERFKAFARELSRAADNQSEK